MGRRVPDGSAVDSDDELLARHAAGDPDAFSELVRRHRDRLWAVALRTLGDREEAADALQDAFVSAYRAAHTFRGQAAVTTWLHRITVNACLDRARKTASRRTSPVDDTERLEQLLEPHESASAPAERNDLHRLPGPDPPGQQPQDRAHAGAGAARESAGATRVGRGTGRAPGFAPRAAYRPRGAPRRAAGGPRAR